MIHLSANRVSLDNLKRQAQAAMRRLPPLLGAEAVRHTKENFRRGGFMDATLQPWEQRKVPDAGRGILIGKGSGHLFRDVRILSRTSNMVTVGTTLPYAKIHNDGGVIAHPGGTAFYKTKDGKLAWVSNQVAARLANAGRRLPRTKPHAIRIPQRKFLGQSISLNKKLHDIVARELKRLTNRP